MICPICERPKVCTRLYGMVCMDRSHGERENEIFIAWIRAPHGNAESFINSYPEMERDAVRRIIDEANDIADRTLPYP
jgi:hypothetical protein